MKVLDLSYHLLDVRSGRWLDLSRKGNHGTPHGGARPYMIAPGVMGFEFDGIDSYVSLPLSVFNSNAGSWGTWINMKKVVSNARVFASDSSLGNNYEFRTFSSGTTNFWFYMGDGSDADLNVNIGNWESSKWWYVCYTWEASGGDTTLKGYKSGVCVAEKTESGVPASPDIGIWIGRWGNLYSECVLAGFEMEDRAWSEAEIRENMYRSPIYRMLRGLPRSFVYVKVPWKQTQGGIYVP